VIIYEPAVQDVKTSEDLYHEAYEPAVQDSKTSTDLDTFEIVVSFRVIYSPLPRFM